MKYTNETIRRQDRLLSQEEALDLLRGGEHGVLSMVSVNGEGYGVPLNYVWDGGEVIYFHCAPMGEKLDNIALNPAVSFCVVGCTNLLADKFTTQYQSVLLKGRAVQVIDDQEKMKALELILDKYSAPYKEKGLKYTKKSFARTAVIRLNIESISGKCKR